MDPLKLSAEQILSTPPDSPEKIFNKTNFQYQLRQMMRKWHPDVSVFDNTDGVFAHLMILAETAKKRLATGTWAGESVLEFSTNDNREFRFHYKIVHEIGIGKMYVGTTNVLFALTKENEDLFDNGIKMLRSIRYPNKKMEQEFTRYFPSIVFVDKTTSVGMVAIFKKDKGTILLRDLVNYLPNHRIDPKHVAWMTSSLYNIAAFLDHVDICHNSIIPSAVFVDTKNHSVSLVGGWWFATKTGEQLKAVPPELLNVLPNKIFHTKTSTTLYDRLAVKGVAIASLGDPTMVGMTLLTKKDIPSPMVKWLRTPSKSNAIKEYESWETTLRTCFGERKFVEFNVNLDNIY